MSTDVHATSKVESQGDLSHIHLASNLVDAVVVVGQTQASDEELMRVLCPGGKLIAGDRVLAKPFPEGIDTWAYPYHGADNNPVSNDRRAVGPFRSQFFCAAAQCTGPDHGRGCGRPGLARLRPLCPSAFRVALDLEASGFQRLQRYAALDGSLSGARITQGNLAPSRSILGHARPQNDLQPVQQGRQARGSSRAAGNKIDFQGGIGADMELLDDSPLARPGFPHDVKALQQNRMAQSDVEDPLSRRQVVRLSEVQSQHVLTQFRGTLDIGLGAGPARLPRAGRGHSAFRRREADHKPGVTAKARRIDPGRSASFHNGPMEGAVEPARLALDVHGDGDRAGRRRTWQPQFKSAAAQGTGVWAAEFALPLGIFLKNKTLASEIGFNIRRTGVPGGETHCWQGTPASPNQWGILTGIPARDSLPSPGYGTRGLTRWYRPPNKAGRSFLAEEEGRTIPLGPGSAHPGTTGEVKLELEGFLLAGDPHARGIIWDLAVDEHKGELYVLCDTRPARGLAEVRVFDRQGEYLRTIMPLNPNLPRSSVRDLCGKMAREGGTELVIPKLFETWGEFSMYGNWWNLPQKMALAPNGDLIMSNIYRGTLWRMKPDGKLPLEGWTSAYHRGRNEPFQSTAWTQDRWHVFDLKNYMPEGRGAYVWKC